MIHRRWRRRPLLRPSFLCQRPARLMHNASVARITSWGQELYRDVCFTKEQKGVVCWGKNKDCLLTGERMPKAVLLMQDLPHLLLLLLLLDFSSHDLFFLLKRKFTKSLACSIIDTAHIRSLRLVAKLAQVAYTFRKCIRCKPISPYKPCKLQSGSPDQHPMGE